MAKYYDGWGILDKMQEDINISIEELSHIIVEEWRKLVEELFYNDGYEPKYYDRDINSFQTRDSINILSVNKGLNNFEVMIGYDISKIETYDVKRPFYSYTAHEHPEKIPSMFEYGDFGGIYGHDDNGIHAMDILIEEINSGKFNNKLRSAMLIRGYDVIFK